MGETNNHKCNSHAELVSKIDVNIALSKEIHKAMFGNGRMGLKDRFEQQTGQISVLKWIAGGGGIVSLIGIALNILEKIK